MAVFLLSCSRLGGRAPKLQTEVHHLVTLTDIAATKVKELMNGQADEPESGLRVAVRGGGCSGFQYALAFDEQRDGDQIFEHGGIRLLIDSESLPFVDGSEVDYVESLQGAGFSVNNPKVVAACGCGQSFRTA
jgi:iron-sulfur cluster assembly accessory protein